jgi:putative tricarboxylic transport membrane protein
VPPLLFGWHVTLGVRWRTALVSALFTTGAIWGLFYKVLGVPLPWGLLKNYAF